MDKLVAKAEAKKAEAPFPLDWKYMRAWELISMEWVPHPSATSFPLITIATTLLFHGCPSEFGESIVTNGFKKLLVNKTLGQMKLDGCGHNFYIDSRKPKKRREEKWNWYSDSSSDDSEETEDDDDDENEIHGLHEAAQYGFSKKHNLPRGEKASVYVIVASTNNPHLLKRGQWQPDKVRVCPYELEGILKIVGHVKIEALRRAR